MVADGSLLMAAASPYPSRRIATSSFQHNTQRFGRTFFTICKFDLGHW